MSDDTYVDELGQTWTRPTAEAYAKLCIAFNRSKAERDDAVKARDDVLAQLQKLTEAVRKAVNQ